MSRIQNIFKNNLQFCKICKICGYKKRKDPKSEIDKNQDPGSSNTGYRYTNAKKIKQVVLDMLESLGVDGEEARLVSQLPIFPQHGRRVHRRGHVQHVIRLLHLRKSKKMYLYCLVFFCRERLCWMRFSLMVKHKIIKRVKASKRRTANANATILLSYPFTPWSRKFCVRLRSQHPPTQ
jgi:hypothetical protein